MFFDPQFSIDGSVSCASCHIPTHAFGSVTPTSSGAQGAPGTRNVPALSNVGYLPYFFSSQRRWIPFLGRGGLFRGATLAQDDQAKLGLRAYKCFAAGPSV